jgi:hypothetical protein
LLNLKKNLQTFERKKKKENQNKQTNNMLYNDFDIYPLFTMFMLEFFWVFDFYHGYIGGIA